MNRDLIAEKAGDFIRNSPEAKDFESHSLLQGVLVDFALTLASNTEIIGGVVESFSCENEEKGSYKCESQCLGCAGLSEM